MLKIYNAYNRDGEFRIDDRVVFNNGRFDTGYYGFGTVINGDNGINYANYEMQTLKEFKSYLQTLERKDGWVKDFTLLKPMTYETLREKYKSVTDDFKLYEEYGLNEEAIVLFTDYVELQSANNELVQKVFGRYVDNGMYLIMPNAQFTLTRYTVEPIKEDYEVLQSRNVGKRLVLTRMDRKITR